jgi:4-amino-4-deoxy-L-arabinose transferase-like glycosyltransferase
MAISALAAFCTMIYWPLDHLFTMNTFEPLIWMGCALIVIRIAKTGNQKLWMWFGVLSGVGLQTKYSMAFFGLGILVGVVLTPERKAFACKWIWIGAAIAFAIFLPNVIWNVQHHWPFLELMRNIRASGRDVQLGPVAFIMQQMMIVGPAVVPVWVAGLLYLFFARDGKPYRVLGWTFLFVAGFLMATKGKDYYMAPVYPMLFAAGGVALERIMQRRWLRWVSFAAGSLAVLELLVFLPYAIPVLTVENFLKYEQKVPLGVQASEKSHTQASMPHTYTWQFGWEEMVAAVGRAYNSLSPEERAKTAIFAQHFGQAGAVDLFGKKYGLPDAISGHQNYWLWGPRNYTGEIVIVIGSTKERELQNFNQVEVGATFDNPYGYPWEQGPILICRGMKGNMHEMWPKVKNWD